MDGVEGEFGRGGVSKFTRASGCDGSADEDFAVGKSDDVGGAGDAEKIAVDGGHGAVSDDGNVDGLREGRGESGARGQGGADKGFECRGVVGGRALAVEKRETRQRIFGRAFRGWFLFPHALGRRCVRGAC